MNYTPDQQPANTLNLPDIRELIATNDNQTVYRGPELPVHIRENEKGIKDIHTRLILIRTKLDELKELIIRNQAERLPALIEETNSLVNGLEESFGGFDFMSGSMGYHQWIFCGQYMDQMERVPLGAGYGEEPLTVTGLNLGAINIEEPGEKDKGIVEAAAQIIQTEIIKIEAFQQRYQGIKAFNRILASLPDYEMQLIEVPAVEQGKALIQAGAGYLDITISLLQQIKEQAASHTPGEDIQGPVIRTDQLVDELDRIASHGQFNGMLLLTGRYGKNIPHDNPWYAPLELNSGPGIEDKVPLYIESVISQELLKEAIPVEKGGWYFDYEKAFGSPESLSAMKTAINRSIQGIEEQKTRMESILKTLPGRMESPAVPLEDMIRSYKLPGEPEGIQSCSEENIKLLIAAGESHRELHKKLKEMKTAAIILANTMLDRSLRWEYSERFEALREEIIALAGTAEYRGVPLLKRKGPLELLAGGNPKDIRSFDTTSGVVEMVTGGGYSGPLSVDSMENANYTIAKIDMAMDTNKKEFYKLQSFTENMIFIQEGARILEGFEERSLYPGDTAYIAGMAGRVYGFIGEMMKRVEYLTWNASSTVYNFEERLIFGQYCKDILGESKNLLRQLLEKLDSLDPKMKETEEFKKIKSQGENLLNNIPALKLPKSAWDPWERQDIFELNKMAVALQGLIKIAPTEEHTKRVPTAEELILPGDIKEYQVMKGLELGLEMMAGAVENSLSYLKENGEPDKELEWQLASEIDFLASVVKKTSVKGEYPFAGEPLTMPLPGGYTLSPLFRELDFKELKANYKQMTPKGLKLQLESYKEGVEYNRNLLRTCDHIFKIYYNNTPANASEELPSNPQQGAEEIRNRQIIILLREIKQHLLFLQAPYTTPAEKKVHHDSLGLLEKALTPLLPDAPALSARTQGEILKVLNEVNNTFNTLSTLAETKTGTNK